MFVNNSFWFGDSKSTWGCCENIVVAFSFFEGGGIIVARTIGGFWLIFNVICGRQFVVVRVRSNSVLNRRGSPWGFTTQWWGKTPSLIARSENGIEEILKCLDCRTKHHRSSDGVPVGVLRRCKSRISHQNFKTEAVSDGYEAVTTKDLRKFDENGYPPLLLASMICQRIKLKDQSVMILMQRTIMVEKMLWWVFWWQIHRGMVVPSK